MLRLHRASVNFIQASQPLSNLDLRDPESAKFLFGGNYDVDSGAIVSEKKSIRLSAVYRAVNLIAGTIASLPVNVIKKTGASRETLTKHPVIKLLKRRANEATNSYKFKEMSLWYVKLWGNCYWRIYYKRDGYTPESFRFYHPDEIEPLFNETKTRKFFRINKTGEVLSADQMLHFMGPSFDGLKGLSVIRYAASQVIGIGLETEKFQATFFKNGVQSSGVVEMPEGVQLASTNDEDAEMQQFISAFNAAYGGSDNRHKIMFLEKGMKFSPVAMPLADAQFIESKKFTVADIARFFDVPLHKLMELERATNNNIEHQSIEFLQDCILPNVRNMEAELDDKLLLDSELEEGVNIRFNLNAMLRADFKTKAEFYKTALGGSSTPAFMSQNEIRSLEDLNPDEDDESFKLFRPLNMQSSTVQEVAP
jgi:HK97 family phage portal protein